MALGAFDYVVLTVTLFASAAIGVYYRLTGGKQQTTKVKHNNNNNYIMICTRIVHGMTIVYLMCLLVVPVTAARRSFF